MHTNKKYLTKILRCIVIFLENNLSLKLHRNKVSIATLSSGIDFLGWVHYFDQRVLRTTTKKRMLKALENNPSKGTVQKYLGRLKHGHTFKLKQKIENK